MVNAGHASLVTMNVIKNNNPARLLHQTSTGRGGSQRVWHLGHLCWRPTMFHGVCRTLSLSVCVRVCVCSQSFCAAAGPCHLVDETKARGKHTITFDSQEPWQRASRFPLTLPSFAAAACQRCNLTKGTTYQAPREVRALHTRDMQRHLHRDLPLCRRHVRQR